MTKDLSDLQGEDIIDVRDIIARVEELRDQRTERWVAGQKWTDQSKFNSQEEFDDCDAAREHVIELMQDRLGDQTDCFMQNHAMDPGERARMKGRMEDLEDAINKLQVAVEERPDGDYSNTIGDAHYYVTKDGNMGLDDDETKELATLESTLDDLQGYGGDEQQWEGNWYPSTLVREGYFEDFARQEAEDIGAISGDEGWPLNCIDWEEAAKLLKQDYSKVDFDGTTYLYRG